MDKKIDIAVIGTNDTVLLLSAVGFRPYITKSLIEVERTIFQLANNKCKIIYIDEELYQKIPQTLQNYQSSLFPMIIPIPMKEDGAGIGLKKIQENVEKAIGINIF